MPLEGCSFIAKADPHRAQALTKVTFGIQVMCVNYPAFERRAFCGSVPASDIVSPGRGMYPGWGTGDLRHSLGRQRVYRSGLGDDPCQAEKVALAMPRQPCPPLPNG
jgi:hypothetical protein